jgi:hypothetical protein
MATQLDRLLADHESPAERARNALRRVFMDPDLYPALVHEIATELCAAEQFMLKGALAAIREGFAGDNR